MPDVADIIWALVLLFPRIMLAITFVDPEFESLAMQFPGNPMVYLLWFILVVGEIGRMFVFAN